METGLAQLEIVMNPLQLPSIPSWETAHPAVVHFPVALLMIAGVPLLLAVFWGSKRVALLLFASGLLLAGVIGAFVATSTGEAGEDVALNMTDAAHRVLHDHEELAELARNLFIGVLVFAAGAAVVAWKTASSTKKVFALASAVVVLLAHGASSLVLANAAHQGGRLVHEFGVRAPLGVGSSGPAVPSQITDPD